MTKVKEWYRHPIHISIFIRETENPSMSTEQSRGLAQGRPKPCGWTVSTKPQNVTSFIVFRVSLVFWSTYLLPFFFWIFVSICQHWTPEYLSCSYELQFQWSKKSLYKQILLVSIHVQFWYIFVFALVDMLFIMLRDCMQNWVRRMIYDRFSRFLTGMKRFLFCHMRQIQRIIFTICGDCWMIHICTRQRNEWGVIVIGKSR